MCRVTLVLRGCEKGWTDDKRLKIVHVSTASGELLTGGTVKGDLAKKAIQFPEKSLSGGRGCGRKKDKRQRVPRVTVSK